MKRLLALVALFFVTLGASAADSYVCDCNTGLGRNAHPSCAAGLDSNSGASAALAKKTSSAANTLLVLQTGGSTVRFCDGGVVNFSAGWSNVSNANCTIASPCKIGRYRPTWLPDPTGQGGSGGTVTYAALSITDTAKTWTVNAWAGYEVEVLTRRGAPMRARIASNTATVLTLSPVLPHATSAWAYLPDAGTAYTVDGAQPALLMATSGFVMQIAGNTTSQKFVIEDVTIGGLRQGVTIADASYTSPTITVHAVGHGATTGELGAFYDSSKLGLNQTLSITVVDADHFTYTCAGCDSNGAITGMGYYVVPTWDVLSSSTNDNLVLNRVTLLGGSVGLQGSGATNVARNCNHITIQNSRFVGVTGIGVLSSCNDTNIIKNVCDHVGAANTDHCVYLGGSANVLTPVTLGSLVGDGTTVLATTTTPHSIQLDVGVTRGSQLTISSASAGFNVTNVQIVSVPSPTTFTYLASGAGTAGAVGTYTVTTSNKMIQATVRNNTFAHGSLGSAGKCALAHSIAHGYWSFIDYSFNDHLEDVIPAATCVGFNPSLGNYGASEIYESIPNLVARGNFYLNMGICMLVGESPDYLFESNYCYSEVVGAVGVQSPKDSQPWVTTTTVNTRGVMRQNTVYIKNPNAFSFGFAQSKNNIPTPGTGFKYTGNLVYFGAGSTGNTAGFIFDAKNSSTDHTDANYYMPASAFVDMTRNLVFFSNGLGAYAWAGGATKTLAAFETWLSLGGGALAGSTADPVFTATPSAANMWDATIQTTSPAKNTGPTTANAAKLDAKACLRDATPDMGAYEYFASACTPVTAPGYGIGVQ